MNQKLQKLLDIIQQNENLSTDQKNSVLKEIKDVDKELEIISFKLDRTEKVKRTTSILLEETIEELEQKRKAVEGADPVIASFIRHYSAHIIVDEPIELIIDTYPVACRV